MAQPSNLTSTYDLSNTAKLDVSDLITLIDPTDMPLFSLCRANGYFTTATGVEHQWLTDTLNAASTSNQRLEGDNPNYVAATTPARPSNICQINEQAAVVSSTQQAIATYAIENTLEYQVAKAMVEIQRHQEATAFGNQAKVNSNESTARKTAGLPTWISTNVSAGSGGSGAGSGAARTDGTQRDLTEAVFEDVMQLAWDQGGMPDHAFTGSFAKRLMNSFGGVVQNQQVVNENDPLIVMGSIDVYGSGLGPKLKILPNRFQRGRDLFALQLDMIRIAELDPMKEVPLPPSRLNVSSDVGVEWTLEVRQEKACAAVYDLKTS